LIEPGNVDLRNRPRVVNKDGSVSSVLSASFNIDGVETLLPRISPKGERWTEQQAIDNYKKTGQHLGKFRTIEDANRAAHKIHLQQEIQSAKPMPKEGDLKDGEVYITSQGPRKWDSERKKFYPLK